MTSKTSKTPTTTGNLTQALAHHRQMTAAMDQTQALIDVETARIEDLAAQLQRATQDRQALDQRLTNSLRQPDGFIFPTRKQQIDAIAAHPEMVEAEARCEALETERATTQARQSALIARWHEQDQERGALRAHVGPLSELHALQQEVGAIESEVATMDTLIEEHRVRLAEPPPADDSQARRADLLARVTLGEPGAADELAALEKTIKAGAADKAKANDARADAALLLQGLEGRKTERQAALAPLRAAERLAMTWHIENDHAAVVARHADLASELHHVHLRLAALDSLLGRDRSIPTPILNLPGYPDTVAARNASRAAEAERLAALGIRLG
jgi:hypothetical protein